MRRLWPPPPRNPSPQTPGSPDKPGGEAGSRRARPWGTRGFGQIGVGGVGEAPPRVGVVIGACLPAGGYGLPSVRDPRPKANAMASGGRRGKRRRPVEKEREGKEGGGGREFRLLPGSPTSGLSPASPWENTIDRPLERAYSRGHRTHVPTMDPFGESHTEAAEPRELPRPTDRQYPPHYCVLYMDGGDEG